MVRILALLAVLACTASTAPIENFDDLPEEVKSVIPTAYADYFRSITAEQKTTLKQLAKELKCFKNEQDFKEALKKKSPSFHEKYERLHAYLNAKITDLDNEWARDFVKKITTEARALHREYLVGNKPSLDDLKAKATAHIVAFKGLPDEAKKQIKEKFPHIYAFTAGTENQEK